MGEIYVKGRVKKNIGTSVTLLFFEDLGIVSVNQEELGSLVPLPLIFRGDEEVAGFYNTDRKTFRPDFTIHGIDAFLQRYPVGTITLGVVTDVTRKTADVSLFPGINFRVNKEEITGNPLDVISSYLGIGDVIPFRIYRHPEGRIRIRMDDIDDDEVVIPASPIFDGGLPWLTEGVNLDLSDGGDVPNETTQDNQVAAAVEVDSSTAPVAIPGPGLQSAEPAGSEAKVQKRALFEARFAAKHSANEQKRLTEENARLKSERLRSDMEVTRIQARLAELQDELSELKAELSEARKQKRAQQQQRSTTFSRRSRFSDDNEWFREEIRRAWIGRYKPQERAEKFPLDFGRFDFSAEFFPSIAPTKLDEDEIRKVVRVILDIATGRSFLENMQEIHELREKLGGPQKTREDGALCWRVHVENGSPQAKRLHYWQLKDGRVEFGWVANHDDDL